MNTTRLTSGLGFLTLGVVAQIVSSAAAATLTLDPGPGGSLQLEGHDWVTSPASYLVEAQSIIRLNARPDEGYAVNRWRYNGIELPNAVGRVSDAITVLGDTTARVTFSSLTLAGPGLVASYSFDRDTTDAGGRALDGTAHDVTWVPDRSGNPGAACSFAGVAHVAVPPAAINGLDQGTIATWVYLRDNTDGVITAKQHDHVDSYALLMVGNVPHSFRGVPGKLYFHARNNVRASSWRNLAPEQWYHVAVVFTRHQAEFYINGLLDSRTAGDFSVPNDLNTTTAIGAWVNDNGPATYHPLDGALDDLRIYERALGRDEVQELARLSLRDGLVGHYLFEDQARDASRHAVHGELKAGASFGEGIRGRGLQLHGGEDQVLIPAHPARSFHSQPFSVAFWFRTLDQDFGYMLDSRAASPERGYGLTIHTAGPGLSWAVQNDGQHHPMPYVSPHSLAYLDGQWHLATGVREAEAIALYVDGRLIERTVIAGDLDVDAALPISLGRRFMPQGPWESYIGDLDELRLYSRALAPVEIQALYGVDLPAPRLSLARGPALGEWIISISGRVDKDLLVESSPDLSSWLTEARLPNADGTVEYTTTTSSPAGGRFFRVREAD